MGKQIQFTNRFGKTYHLSRSHTKTGKTRYLFRAKPGGEVVAEIPEGYEVSESVNGVVSLRKERAPVIRDDEEAAVRSVLATCRNGFLHEVGVKKNAIVVYQRLGLSPELAAVCGNKAPRTKPRFEAVFRFVLADASRRHFMTERMCFSGDGFWLPLGMPGTLERLAAKYLRHVGEESFYDLM